MVLRPLPPGGLPGITFEGRRPSELAPLRTDIALFLGAAPRGPVGAAVRVEGWRTYMNVFGGLSPATYMGHALRGYFENGGQIAWILRLAPGALPGSGLWDTTAAGGFAPSGLGVAAFRFTAASPGEWSAAVSVHPRYRLDSDGTGTIDLDIHEAGRLAEQLAGIDPGALEAAVAERSTLVRVAPEAGAAPLPAAAGAGPRSRVWAPVALSGGTAGATPSRADYAAALALALEEPEVALVALPDLHRHLGEDDAAAVLLAAARLVDPSLDRLVVADAPDRVETAADGAAWIDRFGGDPAVHRTVATYHPWIDMRDPVGTPAAPLRRLPPSGHVAGAISRMDRSFGAYVTPANASLREAVDLARRFEPADQDALATMGLNALRCQSARGIVVWGGRMTRSDDAPPRFVAHRRLIHRLVRALRRVWAPMVFEPNDDALRYAVARSATTLLLEAFHANVLKGLRPDEAFRVVVDDSVNPPDARAAGRLVCEIAIAPATPMEFIHFRVGLSADGRVEFVET
jgi:hypothetical protein